MATFSAAGSETESIAVRQQPRFGGHIRQAADATRPNRSEREMQAMGPVNKLADDLPSAEDELPNFYSRTRRLPPTTRRCRRRRV